MVRRLRNSTNISNERIQEMIEFVRPKKIGRVRIIVQNMRSGGLSAGHTDCSSYVYCRITPDENKFPAIHDIRGKPQKISYGNSVNENGELVFKEKIVRKNGGYLPTLILSREEAFVHLLAHEFRHIWQRTHKGKRGKVWGARGVYSERDADAYAIKMMRKWRKEK